MSDASLARIPPARALMPLCAGLLVLLLGVAIVYADAVARNESVRSGTTIVGVEDLARVSSTVYEDGRVVTTGEGLGDGEVELPESLIEEIYAHLLSQSLLSGFDGEMQVMADASGSWSTSGGWAFFYAAQGAWRINLAGVTFVAGLFLTLAGCFVMAARHASRQAPACETNPEVGD
jgi:hypothetical protein